MGGGKEKLAGHRTHSLLCRWVREAGCRRQPFLRGSRAMDKALVPCTRYYV